jgi:hypothetical protein
MWAVLMAGKRGDQQIADGVEAIRRNERRSSFVNEAEAPQAGHEEVLGDVMVQLRRAAAELPPGDPWREGFTSLADRLGETVRRRQTLRFLS